MNGYRGMFNSWQDIKDNFNTETEEPQYVIYANYCYEDYSGDAFVVFQTQDKKVYTVSGGHCSCNGLEGQWGTVEYSSVNELLKNLTSQKHLSKMEEEALSSLKPFIVEETIESEGKN